MIVSTMAEFEVAEKYPLPYIISRENETLIFMNDYACLLQERVIYTLHPQRYGVRRMEP